MYFILIVDKVCLQNCLDCTKLIYNLQSKKANKLKKGLLQYVLRHSVIENYDTF